MASDLIGSLSVAHLVQQRQVILDRVDRALSLLREAASIEAATFPTAFHGLRRLFMQDFHSSQVDLIGKDALPKIMAEVDAGAWECLLDHSGIRTFLNQEKRQELHESIEKKTFPPITVDSVKATFAGLYERRVEMMEDGVIALFRKLSWDYKSNSPVAFGKRIILRSVIDASHGMAYPNYRTCDTLDDLVRVLHLYDGQPEPDHRNGGIHGQLGDALRAGKWFLENEYFLLRLYRNGNGHIALKRQDLVDQCNRILAKRYPMSLAEAS